MEKVLFCFFLFLLGVPFLVTGLAAFLIVKAQSGIQAVAATRESDLPTQYPIPLKPTLQEAHVLGGRKQ